MITAIAGVSANYLGGAVSYLLIVKVELQGDVLKPKLIEAARSHQANEVAAAMYSPRKSAKSYKCRSGPIPCRSQPVPQARSQEKPVQAGFISRIR